MLEAQTLVLFDARGVLARRGALARQVDGPSEFPDYFSLITEDGLEEAVVWVRWRRDDPHWSGEQDGAFMRWRFATMVPTRDAAKDPCACSAIPVSPTRCRGPGCPLSESDGCCRIRHCAPFYCCPR